MHGTLKLILQMIWADMAIFVFLFHLEPSQEAKGKEVELGLLINALFIPCFCYLCVW